MSIAITVPAPATIDSFAEIVAKIPEWTDGRLAADRVAECIALAEDEIIRRLAIKPVRPMLTIAPVTINAEYAALPAGFIKSVSFEYTDGTTTRELDYLEPINLSLEKQRGHCVTTCPIYFTATANQLRFLPIPTSSFSGSLLYYQRLAGLSPANQTNWFLIDNPSVYWYGTLAQAYAFLPDVEKSAAAYQMFSRLLDQALAAYPKAPNLTRLRTELPRGRQHSGFYD